jgi:thiosulfate/3-mercaptopyruvate sulfurtransferase
MVRHILFALAISFTGYVNAVQLPSAIVDVDWLKKHKENIKLLDIRSDVKSFTQQPKYQLNKKSGKKKLLRVGGHIPGARLIDYSKIRATRVINNKPVQKQVESGGKIQQLLRDAGINKDDTIIITSKGENGGDITMATRLYWTLKYYGHNKLGILDGGTAAWLMAGNDVTSSFAKPGQGDWMATSGNKALLASTQDVKLALRDKNPQLLDTRTIGQYLGTWKKSYVYKPGHVPGAKYFPYELLALPQIPAKFTPADDLRKLADTLAISDKGNFITYCNSGHLASGSWFLLSEVLGYKNTRLYDGSMHEWTVNDHEVTRFKME